MWVLCTQQVLCWNACVCVCVLFRRKQWTVYRQTIKAHSAFAVSFVPIEIYTTKAQISCKHRGNRAFCNTQLTEHCFLFRSFRFYFNVQGIAYFLCIAFNVQAKCLVITFSEWSIFFWNQVKYVKLTRQMNKGNQFPKAKSRIYNKFITKRNIHKW